MITKKQRLQLEAATTEITGAIFSGRLNVGTPFEIERTTETESDNVRIQLRTQSLDHDELVFLNEVMRKYKEVDVQLTSSFDNDGESQFMLSLNVYEDLI